MKMSIGNISRYFALALVFATTAAAAQEQYRLPPQMVVDIIDAPAPPGISVSPDGKWMLIIHRRSWPNIKERAVPMLRLAGNRVNTNTNGPYDAYGPFSPYATDGEGISVIGLDDGTEKRLEAPRGGLGSIVWSPDSRQFAFLHTTDNGIAVWVGAPGTGNSRALTGPQINAAGRGGYYAESPCSWMPDSTSLLCHFVPAGRGAPPAEAAPIGPVIQETESDGAPVWTFANLLENPRDEAMYDYYMMSQPTLVDVETGKRRPIGKVGIYETLKPSADANYYLSVRIVRPYSYLVPAGRFPKQVEILDARGQLLQPVATLPLDTAGNNSGISLGWAAASPRGFAWRPGSPAALIYVEPLDGGNPNHEAEYRDRMMLLRAPFDGDAVELLRTQDRMSVPVSSHFSYQLIAYGRSFTLLGENGLALVKTFDWATRRIQSWQVNTHKPGSQASLVWDLNKEDRYGHPGDPVLTTSKSGELIVKQDGDRIYLTGPGGSPEGDYPFLDRFNLKTRKSERLFRAANESYENVVAVLDSQGQRFVTTYETKKQPFNFYLRDLKRNKRQALTDFPHPAPQLSGMTTQQVNYVRSDGIPLSGNLFLPAGYKKGDRLPTLIWAYPKEYSSKKAAGQVRGSLHRFTDGIRADYKLLVTQGYAVLDDASMPILGGLKANNSFVDQSVANAQAAVDKLVEIGVTDRARVGIAGHSYGAFMTASLLAHSDIFAAGIARSGTFNRSLTPFGFQHERRTFWEAPEVYFQMSPFMHADKINEPILLIHGEIDSNSGTYPIQSKRMYHALNGHGAKARLVMLPYEDHAYFSRESILHAAWEMFDWLDRHVKNRSTDNVAHQ